MAFHVSKRKLKPKEDDEMGELNIVPYLDILMNLIIFILLSMSGLAAFGILNVNAPTYGGGGGAENNDAPELLLTVAISPKGFYVAAKGAVLPGDSADSVVAGEPNTAAPPTIPNKADGTYDYVALTEKMKVVKSSVKQMIDEGKISKGSDSKIILVAEAATEFEVIVGTMDATRETPDKKLLFPDVTLASF